MLVSVVWFHPRQKSEGGYGCHSVDTVCHPIQGEVCHRERMLVWIHVHVLVLVSIVGIHVGERSHQTTV